MDRLNLFLGFLVLALFGIAVMGFYIPLGTALVVGGIIGMSIFSD